jgi:hypothetical protein
VVPASAVAIVTLPLEVPLPAPLESVTSPPEEDVLPPAVKESAPPTLFEDEPDSKYMLPPALELLPGAIAIEPLEPVEESPDAICTEPLFIEAVPVADVAALVIEITPLSEDVLCPDVN